MKGLSRGVGVGLAMAGLAALPFASELRIKRPSQPITDAWRHLPIERRGSTRLGVSFRPLQVEALGLDTRSTLDSLLGYPFEVIRLGAYWRRIESGPGVFDTG